MFLLFDSITGDAQTNISKKKKGELGMERMGRTNLDVCLKRAGDAL
jgi:hypothetical protein